MNISDIAGEKGQVKPQMFIETLILGKCFNKGSLC